MILGSPYRAVFLLLLTSCASTSRDHEWSIDREPSAWEVRGLHATLWSQSAAEFQALARQAYQSAGARLNQALEDPAWSALSPTTGDRRAKPPAVILDVDETVLRNTPYEAWLVREGSTWNRENWSAWCRQAAAEAMPGAVEFVQRAQAMGVHVFYVTNRSRRLAEATRSNLAKVGLIPVPESVTLVFKEDEAAWGGEYPKTGKIHRRRHIERDFRVLQVFGDSLADFAGGDRLVPEQRRALVEEHAERWGKYWFVLPNPMYGSWQRAEIGYRRLPPSETLRKELDGLHPFRIHPSR